jgi:enterobactin synthetase component D / holo-[acyl-carrier protein] synthase
MYNTSSMTVHDDPVQLAPIVLGLFPGPVVAVQVLEDVSVECLLPQERGCVLGSVDKRVKEFAAGRLCARRAMSFLGLNETPLISGPDRAPLWPNSVVGSISHTDGYCTAVVGAKARFAALGVDAERVGRLDAALWCSVFRDEEIDWLRALDDVTQTEMATVIFSAKEAFYKCQYGITRSWLGFEDVAVEVKENTFQVRIRNRHKAVASRLPSLDGRYVRDAGVVITGIAIHA